MPNASTKPDSLAYLSDRIRAFEFRSNALSLTRDFFRRNDFFEVETPIAIRAPAAEEYIEAPRLESGLFLRSSPELEMKRLLAAGMKRIYELAPCFRAGENGRLHRQEFTMLEWYMANSNYREMLDFTIALVRHLAKELNVSAELCDVAQEWELIPVREAFRKFAGEDADLCAEEEARFETVLVEKVEPNLPKDKPCVLIDYPIRFGAFARPKPEDPTLAERWEIYIHGVEVANAYGELIDPVEQESRFLKYNKKRAENGFAEYPEATEFLEAIRYGIPPSSGCALGFDRIVMLLFGAKTLADVAFPLDIG